MRFWGSLAAAPFFLSQTRPAALGSRLKRAAASRELFFPTYMPPEKIILILFAPSGANSARLFVLSQTAHAVSFLLSCVFMLSKRQGRRYIRFNNIHINRVYNRSPFRKQITAKKINAILTCLLTTYRAIQAFSSYFYHAYEQIIAVNGANRINSCKEIINWC